jgi:hypothetical protein
MSELESRLPLALENTNVVFNRSSCVPGTAFTGGWFTGVTVMFTVSVKVRGFGAPSVVPLSVTANVKGTGPPLESSAVLNSMPWICACV